MTIVWKQFAYYGVVLQGYVGKRHLFTISYNSIDKQKGDYLLVTKLPGIKERLFFPSREAAQDKALNILNYWLKSLREEQ